MKLNKNYISLFKNTEKFDHSKEGQKARNKADTLIQKTLIDPK